MARMPAIEAALRVMEKEGVTNAFGVPGAAINELTTISRIIKHQPAVCSPDVQNQMIRG